MRIKSLFTHGLGSRHAGVPAAALSNSRLDDVVEQNEKTFARIRKFRDQGGNYEEFNRLKHEFPFHGMVPCRAENLDFLLYHANDDQVAWEYLWFGDDKYETDIVKTWVGWCRKGGSVLDIGAYTGLMSVLAALANDRNEVHLFEPTLRTIERAKMNVRVNGVAERVSLHNKAVSDSAGFAKLMLYRDENFVCSGNSLFDKGKDIFGSQQVETVPIDTYLPDISPAFVKIDVEGHELKCIEGMKNTITRSRPSMVVEMWAHTRKETLQSLANLGYRCVPFEKNERRVMNFRCDPE